MLRAETVSRSFLAMIVRRLCLNVVQMKNYQRSCAAVIKAQLHGKRLRGGLMVGGFVCSC